MFKAVVLLTYESCSCGICIQVIGPVTIDITKARMAVPDERYLAPVQVIDVVLRQALTCPLNPYEFSNSTVLP